MIFSATNPADHLPKNMDVHGSCKNLSASSTGMNGVEEKPRLVFRIKLPPALNKGKKPCKVIKDRADDQKPVPMPWSGMNGVEKKLCHVTRVKLPTPNNKGIELNGNSGECLKKLAALASGGMNGSDEKKERRVIKIKMPTALRQNKKDHMNIQKTAVQQTGSTNGNSAVPKAVDSNCLKKLEMDEELLELKLEATKRKLHQRYQQAQNS
jgi:hypothetical protein